MPHSNVFPLIFTDLDGTLLDHDTYSAEPADALIRSLHEASAAEIIPVTSKTQSELASLDEALPFERSIKISENGAIIQAPPGSPLSQGQASKTIVLGVHYSTILAAVNKLPDALRRQIVGFADMTDLDVSQHTGLSPKQAKEAKDRQATEPFLWSGTAEQLAELEEHLTAQNIQLQQGGRFYHLTGRATKQEAMQAVVRAFRQHRPSYNYVSIALGDGPNDLQMIEAVDFGVIMPNTAGVAITSEKESVRTAKHPGPTGWVSSVTEILRELGMQWG